VTKPVPLPAAESRPLYGVTAPATLLDPALWAAIVELSADAIITLDANETITSWNRGAHVMMGWTAADVLGKHFRMLLPPEELDSGELDLIRSRTDADSSLRDFETRRLCKDGRVIEVSVTRTAVHVSGALVGYSAVVRDITYRKRLERQLLASERLATAGQVAAGVAHEIGAPLTAIAMMVDHMLKTRCAACAGADQIGLLRSQTDRIARLARDLVQIAKPAGVAAVPLQIADPIRAAGALVRAQATTQRVQISLNLADGLPPVRADASQLEQVMLNLLLNAQRALADKGGTIEVTTSADAGGDWVSVEVSDNGPGIARDVLPHVFTPFFSRAGGSGLGLAIAEQIIGAHHGTIEARSREGHGATFTIRLPTGENHD